MQAATPEPLGGRRGALPWGPKHVLLGILAGILAVVVTNVVFFGLVWGTGAEFQTRDVGDVFEKAGEIATYADERLAAATTGEELPDPPTITADQTTLVLALATTLALNGLLIAVVAVVTQNDMGSLLRQLGFTRFSVRGLWRPAVAVVGCYAMVATYAAIVTALDIKALEPQSTLPTEVIRQPVTGRSDGARAREDTTQPRRARHAMPMPAGRSRRASGSSQPDWPKDSRRAGSAIPRPLSLTVTFSVSSPDFGSAGLAVIST